MPLLVPALLLVATVSPRMEREIIYVAMGGSVESGGARVGDPGRIIERLDRSRPRVRLVDLTSPNATVHDVRNEQLQRAMSSRPSLVTVAIGASDVRGSSSDHADRTFRERVDAFNWAIVRIARRHGFVLADVRARAGSPEGSWEATVGGAIDTALAPRSRSPRGLHGTSRSGAPLALAPDSVRSGLLASAPRQLLS